MATLLTLPLSLQEKISSYLLPPDIAVLSFTCRGLKERLGEANQEFWYNQYRFSNPDLYKTKPIDAKEDYWKKATRTFSNNERGCCRVCLKDLRELAEAVAKGEQMLVFGDSLNEYCVPCHYDFFINAYDFSYRFPEIPIGNPKTYELRRYNRMPVMRASAAIRLVEQHHGIKYEAANNVEFRIRMKWILTRSREEADLVHKALLFMKDDYIQKYRHLHPILGPDEYYDMFANSLQDYILTKPPKWETDSRPSKAIAKDVMKVAKSLADGHFFDSWRRKQASKIVKEIHNRIFTDPTNFRPELLDYPDYHVLFTLIERHAAVNGPLFCHLRHKYGVPDDDEQNVMANARCYWCLRAQKSKDSGDTGRKPEWTDLDNTPYNIVNSPASVFVVHLIKHHPDLIWKRPKLLKDQPLAPIRTVTSQWRGAEFTIKVLESSPNIEKEKLEDIPANLFQHKARVSNSKYFHWV
ncbi:hypothetical protein TWF191_003526 [Orbilia oligospora]|uniref:F-box domain-containing protein n=2 Tax=Orbilia oligospora TaxID=2813651 RepID=A0A7C8U642_ORBOL|nr:hypothetical protein TWF191_003526 [Orbilia oligospora]